MLRVYNKGSALILLLVLLIINSLFASLIYQNLVNKQEKIKLITENNLSQIRNVEYK